MEPRELDECRRTVSTTSGEISYIDSAALTPPPQPVLALTPPPRPNGTGPAALFVHGVGTNAYLWREVIGPLASLRRCLAIDLPLHGQSPVAAGQDLSVAALASVLEDFCDALGLASIDLVANDTGGAVAQVFAARNPHRLATFTLTNCDTAGNLPPEPFKPVVEMAAAGTLAPAMTTMMGDLAAARDAAFGSAYEHPEKVDLEVIRAYLEPCFGTAERAREFERLLTALDSADLEAVEPQLRVLKVPTLVVWGTGDPFMDVSWAYWLRDTIPGVTKVVTIDGARLFFPEERPEDLIPHLAEHWAAHSS